MTKILTKYGIGIEVLKGHPYPYSEMPKVLNSYYIYIDQLSIPAYSKTALEAMACGTPVIGHKDDIEERVKEILHNWDEESKKAREYVLERHDAKHIARRLVNIYHELL